jgi:transcriptional regulator with XRE-family HTH domain
VKRLLTKTEIWQQLKKGKRYRREFAAQFSKRAIPQQIALLRKQFGITQGELAKRAEMTQGAVSRAVDPEYGNLTVNTLVRIASGFDLVFVGTFVRWSELPRWFNRFYSESFTVPSFEEEDAREEQEREQAQLADEIGAIDELTTNAIPVAKVRHNTAPRALEDYVQDSTAATDLVKAITLAASPGSFAVTGADVSMRWQQGTTAQQNNSLPVVISQEATEQSIDNLLQGNFEQRAAQRKAARGLDGSKAQTNAGAYGAKHA